jgi:hypothetical protein
MVKTERIFKVHSGVRKRHTKQKRRATPGRADFVQRFAGGDIIVRRTRPATITESKLKACLPELQRAYDEGRAEVRTVTGQLVDLATLQATEPLPVTPPAPHPPLDSAENDKTFPGGVGEKRPMFREGKALDEEVTPPPSPALPGDEEEDVDDGAPIPQGGDPVAFRKKARLKGKR